MAPVERLTLSLPRGHHAYVLSDLGLSPASDPSSRAVRELAELLGDLDDPAVVVIAGGLFAADASPGVAAPTLERLASLSDALRGFLANPDHRVVVLSGAGDTLCADELSRAYLASLGVTIARDLVLRVATATGVRDLVVAPGDADLDCRFADAADRADATRLEDPSSLARFVASRVLYRRLAPWVWLPVLALLALDLVNLIIVVVNHLGHESVRVRAPHPSGFWNTFALDVLAVVALEALLAAVAGLAVRRRFDRGARTAAPVATAEPLAVTRVDGVDALEVARRVGERGGAGCIVGGAPRPALAFLDRAVCAAPGPSRAVVVERRGRLGLPPVFSAVERVGIVEVEAASAVQVRLYGGQGRLRATRVLERLVATAPRQVAPPNDTSTLGAWPAGQPFPDSPDRLAAQRRRRSVRRWASGLVVLDGLATVGVAVSPPLRSRLHDVLSVLPLSVAQSAAAVAAIAGMGMIMLARGLRRGQRRALFLTCLALAVTLIAHLARGGSVVGPVIAAGLLAFLVTQRDHFTGTTDRSSLRASLPGLGVVAAVAVAGSSIGLEASNHRNLPSFATVVVACVERLVGVTSVALPRLSDRTGDFLNPSLFAVGLTLIAAACYLVTRPVVDRRLRGGARGAERRLAELRAREIVRRHGRGTLDYFALRDDKQLFFFRDTLVAYAVYGGVALVSPDPIGPAPERAEAFSAFRAFAEARGWTIGVMGAGAEWLPTYHAAGLHSIYLGDEAIVDCATFSLAGGKMKGLRQACTRLARHGYTVEVLDPASIDPTRVPRLASLIEMLRWGEGERGFSMMLGRLFDPRDKGLLVTIVSAPDGTPVALCQFVPSPAIGAYSLDIMRRDPGEHPNGLIDYALCSTIEYLRDRGGAALSLNFAAFRSVLEADASEGSFTRVERWALRRLSGVIPIESLWLFNAKYDPGWLPRYIIYPALESFVPVVMAILRAESITELPLLGRFLGDDGAGRPGTIIPDHVLDAARESAEAHASRDSA